MWYDWMVGGWGGRNGKDGANCTSPVFGVGLAVQPLEGQERLSPVVTAATRSSPTPAAPACSAAVRGREGRPADRRREHGDVVLLRPRAVGHLGNRRRPALHPPRRVAEPRHRRGALPRRGVLQRAEGRRQLHPAHRRRRRLRRSAGARPEAVREDVADGYVSVERRRRTTAWWCARSTPSSPSTRSTPRRPRQRARAHPRRAPWVARGGRRSRVAERCFSGGLDQLDVLRVYGAFPSPGTHGRPPPHPPPPRSAPCSAGRRRGSGGPPAPPGQQGGSGRPAPPPPRALDRSDGPPPGAQAEGPERGSPRDDRRDPRRGAGRVPRVHRRGRPALRDPDAGGTGRRRGLGARIGGERTLRTVAGPAFPPASQSP